MSTNPFLQRSVWFLRAAWRPALFFFATLLAAKRWNWDSAHLITMPLLAFLIPALFLARSAAWCRFLDRLAGLWDRHDRHVLPLVCALGLAASLFACFVILNPLPHVADSYSYLFQAKVFASGKLFAADPGLAAFDIPWTVKHQGRGFSQYSPGWPLLLALGVLAHAPALVNPLAGLLSYIVIFLLVQEMAGRRYAKLAVLFCLLSPFYLFLSASFMSHTSFLLFSSLSAFCFVRGMMRSSYRWTALAGFPAGFALLIRPADGLVMWLAMSAYFLFKKRRRSIGPIASTLVGVGTGVLVLLVYNRLLVGQWFVSPFSMMGSVNQYGFGPGIGDPEWGDNFDAPGHTPWRSLLNLNLNLALKPA